MPSHKCAQTWLRSHNVIRQVYISDRDKVFYGLSDISCALRFSGDSAFYLLLTQYLMSVRCQAQQNWTEVCVFMTYGSERLFTWNLRRSATKLL